MGDVMTTNTPRTEPQPATRFRKTSLARIVSAQAIIAAAFGFGFPINATHAGEPAKGATKQLNLGNGVTLEVVFIPPGEFMMGSTREEKQWAT